MTEGYREMIQWLFAREASHGMDFRLERLHPVLSRLGDPHKDLPVVHVGGTNGKGSVAAMLESVWRSAGYRTGLFTSPHLLSFCERIRVNSVSFSEQETLVLVAEVRAAMQAAGIELTFFEISTLAALVAFKRQNLDVVVLEVGLGGRLDATNVVDKLAAVVTSIGLDHMAYLGSTVEAIAREKAGIFAAGRPAVVGVVGEAEAAVFTEVAGGVGAALALAGRDFPREWSGDLPLAGPHQRRNAALAAAVVRNLASFFPAGPEHLAAGFASVSWPGRLQRIAGEPELVLDGAHNPAAVEALVEVLRATPRPAIRTLIFAAMGDKDWRQMLDLLATEVDRVVAVALPEARALAPAEVVTYLEGHGRPAESATDLQAGLLRARQLAGAQGQVLIAGSVFLVAGLYEAATGVGVLFEEGSLAA